MLTINGIFSLACLCGVVPVLIINLRLQAAADVGSVDHENCTGVCHLCYVSSSTLHLQRQCESDCMTALALRGEISVLKFLMSLLEEEELDPEDPNYRRRLKVSSTAQPHPACP